MYTYIACVDNLENYTYFRNFSDIEHCDHTMQISCLTNTNY